MRACISAFPALFLLLMITGCALPGSTFCDVRLEGSVRLDTGEPIANREIQVILPAEYGMGGMDLVFGEPGDYGHHDEQFSGVTDANGEFALDLGTQTYHVTFWLIPPLGFMLSNPPPPLILCRLPDFPDEYYVIETGENYFVIINDSGDEVPIEKAQVQSISASHLVRDGVEGEESVGVVSLVFPGGK